MPNTSLAPTPTIGPALPIMSAWTAVAVATTIHNGTYTNEALFFVVMAVAILTLAVISQNVVPNARQRHWAITIPIAVSAFVSVYFPAGTSGSGLFFAAARGLTTATATIVLLWLVLRLGHTRFVASVILIALTAAGAAMVHASPRPAVDVWYMLQAATNASVHGHNIYTVRWTSGIPSEIRNEFVYLPGSAVVLTPFHVLFGDVRFGILAALAGTAFLLMRMTPNPVNVFLPCLLLLYPKAFFGVEQSWVDPLLLFFLCLAAYFVVTNRANFAILAFIAALTCKQTAWVVLPLAFCWRGFGWRRSAISAAGALVFVTPWIIASPRAFYESAIRYNLFLPVRRDALSLYAAASRHGFRPNSVITACVVLAAIVLTLKRTPLDTAQFVLGAAFVMAVFNVTDKLAFFNEWCLVASLMVVALVLVEAQPPQGDGRPSAEQLVPINSPPPLYRPEDQIEVVA